MKKASIACGHSEADQKEAERLMKTFSVTNVTVVAGDGITVVGEFDAVGAARLKRGVDISNAANQGQKLVVTFA